MSSFPPITIHERDVQIIVEFLVSVIDKQETVYMSAPITSGKRLIEFYKNGNHFGQKSNGFSEVTIQVVESNRSHAKVIAEKIRTKIDSIVINPTLVPDIEGWTQDDYRYLWAKIIERYVKTVICIDDWNYSNGCAYEFLVAKQFNLKTLDERLKILSISSGILLIQKAINDLKEHLLPTKFLESVVVELNKINCVK